MFVRLKKACEKKYPNKISMRRKMTEEEILKSEAFRDKCKEIYDEFRLLKSRVPTLEEMKDIADDAIAYVVTNGLNYVEEETKMKEEAYL